LWTADGKQSVAVLDAHTAAVFRTVFAPDSSLLATASRDATIRLWHVHLDAVVQVTVHKGR
jgi:WD40 repeat protein